MAQQRLGFLLVVVAAAMAMSFILNVPKADAQTILPGIPLVNPLPTGNVTNITGILSCLPLTGATGGINVTLQCGNITATATTNSDGRFNLDINSTITLLELVNGRCVTSVDTPLNCAVRLLPTLTSGIVTFIIGIVIPVLGAGSQVLVLLLNLIIPLITGTVSALVPIFRAT